MRINMQNKDLRFRNGNFRIMQIADTQEASIVSADTLRLLNAAIEKEKPDLVVFTGDQLKGYSASFKGEKNKDAVVNAIRTLLRPLENNSVPFAVTFGNHDGEAFLCNREQFEVYKSSPCCVYDDEFAAINDRGTFCLEIKNGEGEAKALVYLFDTHNKSVDGSFSAVMPYQLDWYRAKRDKYANPLPSFVFQHIPTPEYFDVIKKVRRFSKDCVRAYGSHKNEYYVLDPHNSRVGDFMGESPAAPFVNSGEIDAFLEKKEVRGVFVGHDHNNSFVTDYKGIALCYTQGAGFNVYGPGLDRGVRIIDVSEDGTFDTKQVRFREVCGEEVTKKGKYYFYKYAPTSVSGVVTFVKEAVITAAAVTAGVKIIKAIAKKK